MTEDDKHALAAAIADELRDSAYGIATGNDRRRTARLVADRIEPVLYQMGWMPAATYGRIRDWAAQAGNIPEHHINRSVLNSHLAELAQILADR